MTSALTLSAALVAALARPFLPGTQSYQQVSTPVWLVALAVVCGALALTGRATRTTGTLGCVLLLWASAGLPLDGFRFFFWATGIPAGDFALVDWPGALSRGTALAALLALLVTLLRTRRRDHRDQRGLGHLALALALPYPALKVYWWLDGGAPPLGEVLAFGAAALLAYALVRTWPLPRPLLLLSGTIATIALISQGSMPIFAALSVPLGGPALPFDLGDPATLVVLVVYLSWALLGVTLAAATLGFADRTRPQRPTVLT
ncbi:hypothetical protein [Crossiella sp. NPDC003009]